MYAYRFAVVTALLALSTGSLFAHHSFSSEFDVNKPITLKGTLTRMEWVNPHGWLYMDVKQPDGTVVNWGVEAGAPSGLIRRGLRKADFPAGIEIVVQGFAARNGSHNANGTTVKLPDGRNFFLSIAPNGQPAEKY